MSSGDPIRVFVTHAWQEGDDYLRVYEYLESARNFRYFNCSAPGRRPDGQVVDTERDELRRQISTAEAVIALSSMIATDRALLHFEINFAKSIDKPVIMLPAFGSELALPAEFRGLADENAAWDERAIVDALRRQARHQESTRWDTIEFKLD